LMLGVKRADAVAPNQKEWRVGENLKALGKRKAETGEAVNYKRRQTQGREKSNLKSQAATCAFGPKIYSEKWIHSSYLPKRKLWIRGGKNITREKKREGKNSFFSRLLFLETSRTVTFNQETTRPNLRERS